MNLAATVVLYGGGPGSGCNPEKAQPRCGRPSGAGHSGDAAQVKQYIKEFKPVFREAVQKMKATVGDMGLVEARLKKESSIVEKMGRKNVTLDQIHDIAGMRVSVKSIADVYSAVQKLKGQFQIIEEEDKIKNPTDGYYRAYHMQASVDGKPVEIQVRTENQSRLAVWAHDSIYKGALRGVSSAKDYAVALGNYLYNLDMGVPGVEPNCPPSIGNCFNMTRPFVEHIV